MLAASVAFFGTHFLLSHPLRAPIVSRIGAGPFLGLYSLVAFITLGWMIVAYRAIPGEATLWQVGDGLWALATLLMLFASILLAGSLIANPALPGAGTGKVPAPRGVLAITRHPMMWSFAIWAAVHIAVYPMQANIVVAVTIVLLALIGAACQDAKKARIEPDFWPQWSANTSYWPFGALVLGKLPWSVAVPNAATIIGGAIIWLAASWAHLPLGGMAAGIWRWIG